MKKISIVILVVLTFVLTLSLVSCNNSTDETVVQDTSPITISAPLNSRAYFLELEKYIEEDLGIQVDIEWEDVLEHTQYTLQKIENGCSTDIVFSPVRPSDEVLKNNFVDISTTSFAKLYSSKILANYSIDKEIYMLPYASTLYGITYNKTLFEENGWDVPTSYADLVSLKSKCDAKGVKFSSTILSSVGDGFNYLLRIAGSGYLSTLSGEEWINNFLTDDSTSVNNFSSSVDYLYKLNELGFFGEILTSAWDSKYTNENRCAFFIGNIAGAKTYTDPDTGSTDEYGLIPYFSEDGYTKGFVMADNTLFGINKSLEAANKQTKLEQAKQILYYLSTNEKAINLTLGTSSSAYMATSSFRATENTMYTDYLDDVKNGFVIDNYATNFDTSVINAVSPLINNYLKGEEVTKSNILTTFKDAQHAVLTDTVEIVGKMGETLTVAQTAEMLCKAAGIYMQKTFDTIGINTQVQVSMVPYAESLVIKDLTDSRFAIRFRAQKDELSQLMIGTMYNSPIRNIVAIELTGAEIKAAQKNGFDSDLTSDTNTVNPWLVVTKNNITLNDTDTYVVAVPVKLVSSLSSTATQIKDSESKTIQIGMIDAMTDLFKSMDTVYLKDIQF